MTSEIRPADAADADAIVAIYGWYVDHTAITFDVERPSVEQRSAWLAEHRGGRHLALVAVEDRRVVGYATSGRHRPTAAYDPSVETSVYVDHGHLGRGIGSALYADLLGRLEREDVHRAYAGVALPNDASMALHRRFGFREVGRFTEQGRKFGRYWDVVWFEREMPGAPP